LRWRESKKPDGANPKPGKPCGARLGRAPARERGGAAADFLIKRKAGGRRPVYRKAQDGVTRRDDREGSMRSAVRRASNVGLVLAILTGSTQAGAQTTADRFIPFGEFIEDTRAAIVSRYVLRPPNRVRSSVAFGEMRRYLLRLYEGVHVTQSYLIDAQYFDCIPIAEQPSVRLLGLRRVETVPPRPTRLPDGLAGPAPDAGPRMPRVGFDRTADKFGNAIPCKSGTIPMRRISLEELSRFETLQQFLRKGPSGVGQFGKGPRAARHKYAHAFQSVPNLGGASFLSIWKPRVVEADGEIFSLSQHWYTNRTSSGKIQTIEGGWQNYPRLYGVNKSVLFIYWTADGYDESGCYNLTCPAFVQTNPGIHLGGTFPNYSVVGGLQYAFKLQWEVFAASAGWWLYYDDAAVGYYPTTLFEGGPLATAASGIDYGGETVGNTEWPPMGSGKFAKRGAGYAAYQRHIFYINTNRRYRFARLNKDEPTPSCYTIKVFNRSADPVWRTHFFFGGPGGTVC
jgi:hypothetical protein